MVSLFSVDEILNIPFPSVLYLVAGSFSDQFVFDDFVSPLPDEFNWSRYI